MTVAPRTLLLAALALAVLAVAGALAWKALTPRSPLTFVERVDPAGFRDLVMADRVAAASAGVLPPAGGAAAGAVPMDLCRALYDDPEDPRLGTGETVAVYFTDYRCPYCRVLGALLRDRAEAGEITLIVKEWPILGPPSEAAARMALAAARQGAWLPAHERLTHTPFVPNAAYAAELARGLGIDPARLAEDLGDPAIDAHLARTAELADRLGLRGSPGLVVGRTVAKRSVREPLLDRLIGVEQGLGPVPC